MNATSQFINNFERFVYQAMGKELKDMIIFSPPHLKTLHRWTESIYCACPSNFQTCCNPRETILSARL